MKFGIRKPSLKKRIAARTSWKRFVRHSLGLKASRGWGWLTNPKKAAYNRVYNRTSVSVDGLFSGGSKRSRSRTSSSASSSGCALLIAVAFLLYFLVSMVHNTSPLRLISIIVLLVSILFAIFWYNKKVAAEAKARDEAARQTRADELAARFGADDARRIQGQELWQGATSAMVLEMFGAPIQIDEKILKTKTKTTYKYFQTGKNRFALKITLDNGVVVKWDDKR
jgi:hypothetical protein